MRGNIDGLLINLSSALFTFYFLLFTLFFYLNIFLTKLVGPFTYFNPAIFPSKPSVPSVSLYLPILRSEPSITSPPIVVSNDIREVVADITLVTPVRCALLRLSILIVCGRTGDRCCSALVFLSWLIVIVYAATHRKIT